jgi:glycosyltransferase involved in cell wall biosynthesis
VRIIQIIDVRWYNACADFAIKQTQGLALAGHDILFMANPDSPPAIKARELGLALNQEIDFSKSSKIFSSVNRLRKIARDFKADCILAHRGESHLIAALARRGEAFHIARFRGDVRPPRKNLFSKWLNTKLTDGVAVSTERLRFDYEKAFGGISPKVIYPGIDASLYKNKAARSKLKRKFDLNPDDPVIGLIGRLSPVKGHRYFVEAAKLVSMQYPRAQFIVAGGDAQITLAELQISAALLKIPHIKFMGVVENISDLLGAFDIGVITSIGSEMICRVLLEYYAAGLPAIGTSVNQISELLLQSNGGILVPQSDPVALSNAIIEMLADRKKMAAFAANGSRWVSSRTLKTLGEETAQFLAEVAHA